MEKYTLIKLIEEGFSIRKIADSLNLPPTNIRYWLKKFELKTKHKKQIVLEKCCPKCNLIKSINDFYFHNTITRKRYGGYCKECSNNYHSKRVKEIKLKMIEYKGGKCERCKLTVDQSHYSVFEFHHIDPLTKDPYFHKIKYKNWNYIINELNKCKLLCANCHRITHAEIECW